jgi:hypothetical protein
MGKAMLYYNPIPLPSFRSVSTGYIIDPISMVAPLLLIWTNERLPPL